jgi:hypothetical protein
MTWTFRQQGILELTHNRGTQGQADLLADLGR